MRRLSAAPGPRAPALRTSRPPRHAPLQRTRAVGDDAAYAALRGVTVCRPGDPTPVDLLSTFKAGPADRTVLVLLTHCADLAPQELIPKLVARSPAWAAAGVQLRMVALGSASNVAVLKDVLRVPDGLLFADGAGAAHAALGLSRGYDPQLPVKINPYVRLTAMLAGVGSPGTMGEVFRGYRGDKSAPQIFATGPFDVLGTGFQRPMELATVRLNSMVTSLTRWKELAPPDDALLTWLGGARVFGGRTTLLAHDDPGILKTVDVDEVERVVAARKELTEGR